MTDPDRSQAEATAPWAQGADGRPFTPPASRGLAWLAVLLVLAGAGLIGFSVLGPQASLLALRSAATSLVTAVQSVLAPGRDPDPAVPPEPPAPPADAPSGLTPAAQTLTAVAAPSPPPVRPAARRCVRNGHTTFTDSPCPDGASSQALDLPVAAAAPAASGTVTLYRCRSHNGSWFWSRAHCHRQGARIDRMTQVPADLSQVQQIRLAEQQRLELRALTHPAPGPKLRVAQGPSGDGGRHSRCDRIARRIDGIDSLTRQALSGPDQDRLRAERQGLRDEQFSLRCP